MMFNKRTSGIPLVLAALMLSASLMSCGDGEVSDTKETAPAGTTAATEAADDSFGLRGDFGGETFTFLVPGVNAECGADWETFDIYAEMETGDVITDAVYARNMWMEDTFNVKIAEHKPDTSVRAEAKTAITAGDNYFDALIANFTAGCDLAQNGMLFDLGSVPNIDLSNTWWDQGAINGTSIGGKVYMATGDISIVDNDATWVLMFNKQLADDFDFDMYGTVRGTDWTYDTFYSMIQAASQDLNGDGKMMIGEDRFGIVTTHNTGDALLFASGETICEKDSDGYPVLRADMNRLTSVVTKAAEIYSDKNRVYHQNYAESRPAFESGQALFYGEVLQCVTRMRQSDTDFGIIPWPKFDDTQDAYYSFIITIAGTGVAVPITQDNLEMAGTVIEAMAAKSVSTVTEAYYDQALTYKYMRDEESVEMLDMILGSRIYDLAYDYIFGWGGLHGAILNQIKAGQSNVASVWDANISAAEEAMHATVSAFRAES